MPVRRQLRTIVHHLLWIEIVGVTRVRYYRYAVGNEDDTLAYSGVKEIEVYWPSGKLSISFFPCWPRYYRHSFCREGFPVVGQLGRLIILNVYSSLV